MDLQLIQTQIKAFFMKVREILAEPDYFFKSVAKESLQPVLWYYGVFAVVAVVLALPMLPQLLQPALEKFQMTFNPSMYFFFVIAALVFYYVQVFIGVAVTHGLIKLFKGTASFFQTVKVMMYGATPEYLLQTLLGVLSLVVMAYLKSFTTAVVIVNAVVVAYRVYIQTIGMSQYHGIDRMKAVLAVFIIPYALVFLILLLLKQYVPMAPAP